jgi:hypothetical protein
MTSDAVEPFDDCGVAGVSVMGHPLI